LHKLIYNDICVVHERSVCMSLEKKIGEKLKNIRTQRGYSIREVGDKTGMHYTYISKIENGQKSSIGTLEKLCSLYNIKMSSLFGEEVDAPKELKELGVEWITFAEEMEKQNLTPEEVKKYIEVIKNLKSLS
jgi:transcriptional regulator with XRE-family HTH domain